MSRSEPLLLPAPTLGARRPSSAQPTAPTFAAQVLGQGGARRGLREGEAALKRARGAYLATEWSGDDDRRPEAGLLIRGRL